MTEDKGLYARAHRAFEERFIPAHRGITFSREKVYAFFNLNRPPKTKNAEGLVVDSFDSTEYKEAIGQLLYKLSDRNKLNKNPLLEQVNRDSYRIVDTELNEIKWWEESTLKALDVTWPYGIDDNSEFGFERDIVIYPGDVIGIAGEGNKGKTTMALNFLLNNLDKFPESIYFTTEFNSTKFRERIKSFDWVNIYNGDGQPRFRLAKHEANFQDVLIPAGNNIVDWVDMPDEPWKIGQIFKKASEKLTTGVCFICLQKRSYKTFAVGGEAAMDYASAFFTISYDKSLVSNVLKVEKVKEPGENNPNYKKFKFGIERGGAKLFAIEEIRE